MVILAGKSASGKTTIADFLIKEKGFKQIVTYTTRLPRQNEVDGVTYHFITKDKFFELKNNGFFAEYNSFVKADEGEVYYGTAIEDVEKADEYTVIILEPHGVNMLLSKVKKPIYIPYIYATNNVIKQRLLKRGDNPNEILRRIKHDNEDFRGFDQIAHRIFYSKDDTKVEDISEDIVNQYKEWLAKNSGGE